MRLAVAQRKNEAREVGKSERLTRRFRVGRLIIARRESKIRRVSIKSRSCMCSLDHNLASFPGDQPLISSTRHHLIFLFLIPLLIGLLQVYYQGRKNPFDAHRLNMWAFLASTCIYCVGLASNLELQNGTSYSKIVSNVILSSGALASISLASVLFPPLIEWLCFCLWIILPVTLAREFIKHIYEWLKHGTIKTISAASLRFNRFWGSLTLTKKQHLPM